MKVNEGLKFEEQQVEFNTLREGWWEDYQSAYV
jgi:hypothetical protein